MTLNLSYSPSGIYNQKAASVGRQKKKLVTHIQKGFHYLKDGYLVVPERGRGTGWKGTGVRFSKNSDRYAVWSKKHLPSPEPKTSQQGMPTTSLNTRGKLDLGKSITVVGVRMTRNHCLPRLDMGTQLATSTFEGPELPCKT